MINFRKYVNKALLSLIMLIFACFMITPLIWMFSTSFKPDLEVYRRPFQLISGNFHFNNYIEALTGFPFLIWYWNSIKVAVITILLATTSSIMAGYAFGRLKFRAKNVIFMIFLANMMIPMEIRLIPQFFLYRQMGLVNTHAAVILPWIFYAFGIFFFRQVFKTIPAELSEVAKIDGAGEFRIFLNIILPLVKTSVITIILLCFNGIWNNYLMPLVYISSVNKQLLPVGLSFFKTEYADRIAISMAGMSMAIIPLIALFLALQKYFVEGITVTGLKI